MTGRRGAGVRTSSAGRSSGTTRGIERPLAPLVPLPLLPVTGPAGSIPSSPQHTALADLYAISVSKLVRPGKAAPVNTMVLSDGEQRVATLNS